ncbi:MAG: hypothetical protein IJ365_08180 [Clostridia bacterium]|nr:hypothetical protein [Clostridia bacterium]
MEIDFKQCDCILSDNYIDLTDNKPYKLHINTEYDAKMLEKELVIKSVYDIGKQIVILLSIDTY